MNTLTRLSTELTHPSPLFFGYGIAAHFTAKLEEALLDVPADKVFLVADQGVYGAHAGRDTTEMPQVVLLDLKLPKLDGLGVLRRLRAELWPQVVSVTSFPASGGRTTR